MKDIINLASELLERLGGMNVSQLVVAVVIVAVWRMPNIIQSITQYRKENRKQNKEK